jgi:PIN like domain
VPTPEPQPKFFLDRSLGRVAVPMLLRAAGWNLVTLAEHYGVPQDEQVADTKWIQDAATFGWPILMKDKRIRYRPAEIDAVIQYEAQCFVITRGDLPSAEMASRFMTVRQAIFEAVTTPGPYIYAVQADRIDRLYPPQS